VTYTCISAYRYSARGTAPITCIRVVQPDDIDYSKVREVGKLAEGSEAVIGNAGVSAGVSLLFTTSWKIILATFLNGLIVDRLLAAMEHWRVPPFFQQFARAGLITLMLRA
jgi:uncharacterized membrane protein YjjP (DUF1212 family)